MPPTEISSGNEPLAPEKLFEFFKFYEEAAERTKSHAWTQSAWILTLNGAILGFSLKLYVEHISARGFLFIEWISTLAGLLLCAYLIFVLYELGGHIQHYWTAANKLAAKSTILSDYIGPKEATAAQHEAYRAKFPKFIARLMVPPSLFAIAHLTWGIYVTATNLCPFH
jgi:hypothetical protein